MLTSVFICSSIHFYYVLVIQLFLKMMFSSWLLRSPCLNSWKQLFNLLFSRRITYIIVRGLPVYCVLWCAHLMFPFRFYFLSWFCYTCPFSLRFPTFVPSHFSILQHIFSVVLCCVSEDKQVYYCMMNLTYKLMKWWDQLKEVMSIAVFY